MSVQYKCDICGEVCSKPHEIKFNMPGVDYSFHACHECKLYILDRIRRV